VLEHSKNVIALGFQILCLRVHARSSAADEKIPGPSVGAEVRGFILSLTLYDTQSKEILLAVYGSIT